MAVIHYVHYPKRLTGKVRIRNGLLGRIIPQVEYKAEAFIELAGKENTTMWRDAELSDILLLGEFSKDSSDSHTTVFEGAPLKDIVHG